MSLLRSWYALMIVALIGIVTFDLSDKVITTKADLFPTAVGCREISRRVESPFAIFRVPFSESEKSVSPEIDIDESGRESQPVL